jgi:O-antigen/teichoic acid export membrane protein
MGIVKDSIKTLGAQVFNLFLAFITSIVLARTLGPSGNGKYSVIVLVPTLLQLIGALGIPAAIVYFGSEGKYPISVLIGTSLYIALLAGAATILLFTLITVTRPYQNFIASEGLNPYLVWLAVMSVPPYLIFQYLRQALRSQSRIGAFNFVTVFQIGSTLVCIGLTLFFTKLELVGAVLGYLLGNLFAAVLAIYLVSRVTRLHLAFEVNLVKKMVHFGFRSYIGSIFQFLNYRLDVFLVTALAGTTAVGYYVVAVTLVERIWDLPNAIRTVLQPRMTAVSEQESIRMAVVFTRNVFMLGGLLGLSLAFLDRFAIKLLFGKEYLPAAQALLILLPGAVVFSINKILAAHLVARGYPQIPSATAIIGLLVNIPLNLLLVPRWGMRGAAVASTAMYLVVTLMVIFWFFNRFGVPVKEFLLIKDQDLAMYRKVGSNPWKYLIATLRN